MQDEKSLTLFDLEDEPKAKSKQKVRRPKKDEAGHRVRRRSVAGKQRQQVFQVLRSSYPHPVSHANICEKVGTNRASHRIRELVQDGWSIEGAGVLGLDAGSQTQLYRLASLDRGAPQVKYMGLKVLWDQSGLKVGLHRDIDDVVDPRTLQELAQKIEALVREELEERISAMTYEALDAS